MKFENTLIIALSLFTLLFSTTVQAETIVLKNGKELKVEKAWSEGGQVNFIFHGMQASLPQSKVKQIKPFPKDADQASDRQKDKMTVSKKTNRKSVKNLPGAQKKNEEPISSKFQPTAMATNPSCELFVDGFCGLKWGVNVSKVYGLEKKKAVSGLDEVIEYTRPKDILKIGDATVKAIVYSFWRKKLYTVTIWTLDHSNYTALRERVFVKFGKGRQVDPTSETYVWSNTHTDIMLEYEEKGQLGMLWLRSNEMDRRYKLSILNRHTSYLRWMKSRN